MKVALCCIGRLENRYIKEYVDFYLGIGVDKIFLYDNNYDGEEYFEDVINEYISNGSVEIVNFRNQSYCQLKAYQDCYDKHSSEYDWFCFFDIDEFIAFQNVKTIKEWLSLPIYSDYDMIHINFLTFNDNNLIKYENKPVLERFTNVVKPLTFSKRNGVIENNHIKSVIKGNICVEWKETPHTPSNEINCCDATGKKCDSKKPFIPFIYSNVLLRHFPTKTIEEYRDIKVKRGYPDGNKNFFKENDWVNEFFLYNERTKEKMDFLGVKEKNDVDIFICTHKDFNNILKNKTYKIINSNDINGDIAHNGLKGSFYSEIMSYFHIKDNIELKKYVGVCSYRKYFEFMDDIPNMDEIFKQWDVIACEPITFKGTVRWQYALCHNVEDLDIVEEIIRKKFPTYLDAFESVMNTSMMFPCNMVIMKKEDFEEYVDFIRNVLDEYIKYVGVDIEKRIENNKEKYLKNFSPNNEVWYQYRIGGYLAERLTNVFLLKHFKKIKTYKMIITEQKYNKNE